ncbi:MAG: endolytic transglycosylase MltG [Firmicutes bacterium]|nr:endolytic transglycosylase MltG [Bacillota bacterium]MTI69608.1 endolytic transglycosylase MltG [Bacillota bacterium]
MKNLFEGLKDILYDSMDYLIILVVVLVVGGVIGWRLGVLFDSDIEKTPISVAAENNENNEDNISNSSDTPSVDKEEDTDEITPSEDSTKDVADISSKDSTKDTDDTTKENTEVKEEVKTITISIPQGSLGPTIAKILIDNDLIESKSEFLSTAEELGLDRYLRSGNYKIKTNSSLENIIKIIAGRN